MTQLLYDGDCPFCSNYVGWLNLKQKFPDIELVNAREFPNHEAINILRREGLLLDDGMALITNAGQIHHGADAIHALASGKSLNGRIFGSQFAAKALYPALKLGRAITLKLMRRKKLGF